MVTAMAVEGCATRGWVTDVARRDEARIDARLGRVLGEMARLDRQLSSVERRVTESSETAAWAQRRADEAYARADDANTRVHRLWAARHTRERAEIVHVPFGFDRADLSDDTRNALLGIIDELKDDPELTVDLEGFTEASGVREDDLSLSQQRMEAVRRFLIAHGADLSRLTVRLLLTAP
jgi:outer membrane protein OmpA-like peptidoglycan-associated protein